jgi:hypothetical protein
MFVATATFFGIYYGTKLLMEYGLMPDTIAMKNNCLWVSFLTYLLLRGVMQYIFSPKAIYKQVEHD